MLPGQQPSIFESWRMADSVTITWLDSSFWETVVWIQFVLCLKWRFYQPMFCVFLKKWRKEFARTLGLKNFGRTHRFEKKKLIENVSQVKGKKGKVVPGCIDPHFLDLGTSWRWMVSFTPLPLYPRGKSPRYPLDRRLGGPQSRCWWRGEEKILDPTGTWTPTPQSSSP
jgi:hypothetical protein